MRKYTLTTKVTWERIKMGAMGRKSTYKRAFKEAQQEGLRRPKKKPTVNTKYREYQEGYDYE